MKIRLSERASEQLTLLLDYLELDGHLKCATILS